jgi:hypothetical protein
MSPSAKWDFTEKWDLEGQQDAFSTVFLPKLPMPSVALRITYVIAVIGFYPAFQLILPIVLMVFSSNFHRYFICVRDDNLSFPSVTLFIL